MLLFLPGAAAASPVCQLCAAKRRGACNPCIRPHTPHANRQGHTQRLQRCRVVSCQAAFCLDVACCSRRTTGMSQQPCIAGEREEETWMAKPR